MPVVLSIVSTAIKLAGKQTGGNDVLERAMRYTCKFVPNKSQEANVQHSLREIYTSR